MVINGQLSGIDDNIANMLSTAVTSKATAEGPNILASSYDKFVRTTPGGKIVMKKLSMGTLLPVFALGFLAGWIIRGKSK